MPASSRSSIVNAIKDNCGKIKNLVFAILIAKNRLICLIRMKKYSIHQADLRYAFVVLQLKLNLANLRFYCDIVRLFEFYPEI